MLYFSLPTKSLFTSPLAFLHNLQGWEILIIFFVILLLFGAKKLPELARGIGKAIREFKTAAHDAEDSFRQAIDTPPSSTTPPHSDKNHPTSETSKPLSEPKK